MVQVHLDFVLTVLDGTSENGFHHIWHEIGATDYDALQGNQVLNVRGVHAAHDLVVLLYQVMYLHLASAKIFGLIAEFPHGDVPQLPIKDGDDFSWEADKIVIKPFGKLSNM